MISRFFKKIASLLTKPVKPKEANATQDWIIARTEERNAASDQKKWAAFKNAYPQTYAALLAVADARPDMAGVVKDFREDRLGECREFSLEVPGSETVGSPPAAGDSSEPKLYPIRVQISLDQQRIFTAGTTMGALTDADAAKAVLERAAKEGYVVLDTSPALGGLPRDLGLIKAGPKGQTVLPERRPRLVASNPKGPL